VFSDACHRHGWLPRLPHSAVIYAEELPFHHDQVARFIPEFVMAQLESAAALDRLPFTTTRNLVVVLIETGLRGGDACGLAFSPTLDDSAGWPCLRFEAAKVRAEQLIPLSAKAAAAIRSQQEHVLQRWPAGSPWLFPGITRNDDGTKPYSHMTAHYARIHDTTIREAFDHYQSQRVNIAGETLGYDPDAPTAAAEWVKHNLSRIRDSLPNGYCGRPPPARLPPPQRLPHLPRLPDHTRVPRHPPPPGHHQPAPHHPRRRERPDPPRRQPPPGARQPRTHHPRSRSTPGQRGTRR
jgi:hypothetical protein